MTALNAAAPGGVALPLSARLQRALSRKTHGGRFIPEIDGLRFPAITIVVIGHLCAYFHEVSAYPRARTPLESLLQWPIDQSGKGVFLFFIISGYVLALPFVRMHCANGPPVRLSEYFLRRVTRLEPPYMLVLLLFLFIKIAGRAAGQTVGTEGVPELIRHFFASAVYLHNMVYGVPSTINGVAWSLEVEIQFYLLMPLLARIFMIRTATTRRLILVSLALLSVALQYRFGAVPNRWAYSVAGSLHLFVLGLLLADVSVVDALFDDATTTRWWDAVALIGWPALLLMPRASPWTAVLFPVTCVALFIAAFRGTVTNRFFRAKIVTTLGGMCYSIYLLHFMLIGVIGRVIFARLPSTGTLLTDFLVQAPMLLAFALAFSAIFFMLIERPCMDRDWPVRLVAALQARFRQPA